MHRISWLLPIGLATITTFSACGGGKKSSSAEPAMPAEPVSEPVATDAPATPETPATPPTPPKAEEPVNTTDSELPGALLNLTELADWKPVPSLPKGATMVMLEGTPPFAEGKSFAFLLKLPKNYKIPPHTHLVTERVTVMSGSMNFGHGDKFDKKTTKEIKTGGVVIVPTGHSHYVWTKGETVLQLQGVGPWGIFYVDPKDDPRKPAPAKPADVAHPTDSDMQATMLNHADVKWVPGPPSLPSGVQFAVIEGAPPFPAGKSFVFRLKMPDGYKIPVHHHPVSERVSVVSGTLKFGMGDTWDDTKMKALKVGGVAYMPRGHKHFVQAQGETIVQLQGVGPWGIVYANPDEDPRNKK